MIDAAPDAAVPVVVVDTSGLAYAEIEGGELRRVRRITWELAQRVPHVFAVAHDRGLTVGATIQASNMPLLVGPADGSDLQPVPSIPERRLSAVLGVTHDGTALVQVDWGRSGSPNGRCFFLRWGSQEWNEIDVPASVGLGGVVGSAGEDTVYVSGATGPLFEHRPALFEVDLAERTLKELSLPAQGPTWRRRDRLRRYPFDPSEGQLDLGAGNGELFVCVAADMDWNWDDHGVLHAIDRSRGLWSTVTLAFDQVLDLQVTADGTAHVVTSKGRLWTYTRAKGWKRTAFRRGNAAFLGGRLLVSTEHEVVSCAVDGTDARTLLQRDGTSPQIRCFARPPTGVRRI
ncbi:hypothetical protein [Streptomyces sp. NPDC002889]|uniref:hypothetical protein n=1 Tax=Streptomyces sp. NPDC002889 TaxID=3364669 RepID=UPI0036850533